MIFTRFSFYQTHYQSSNSVKNVLESAKLGYLSYFLIFAIFKMMVSCLDKPKSKENTILTSIKIIYVYIEGWN